MPSIMNMDDSLTYDFRLSDTPDAGNTSNNNPFTGSKENHPFATGSQSEDTEADVTLHDDDDSSQLSSLHTDSTARAEVQNGRRTVSDDVSKNKPLEKKKKSSAESSQKSLQFITGHFKENSSDEEEESRLGHGLEFPDMDNNETSGETSSAQAAAVSAGALGLLSNMAQGGGQQMGAILAGALSGAQDTVTNVVASQMMSSFMQKAGLQKAPVDPKVKVRLEGQGSRDSDTEFEFLSQEDFENLDDQQG